MRRQLLVDGITVNVFKEFQLPRLAIGSLVLSPLSLFVLRKASALYVSIWRNASLTSILDLSLEAAS